MQPITLYRVLKLGWTNYWRNRGLSISATLILTLTLFIVLIFMLINGVISIASDQIRTKIGQVDIFFNDSVSEEQIELLADAVAARPDVSGVHYVSKEEAIQRFQQFPGISDRAKQATLEGKNPLPRSLEIKATDPSKLEGISNFLSESPRKEMIRRNTYNLNKETVQRLSKFERAVTWVGLALTIIFTAISLIVVLSTIRLAIFARREEIEIMRLVGANNIFIRVPFIVEGILYGLVASAIALVAVWMIVQRLGDVLGQYIRGVIPLDLPVLFEDQLPTLIITEVGLGLGIAILASLISIQRYLKR